MERELERGPTVEEGGVGGKKLYSWSIQGVRCSPEVD